MAFQPIQPSLAGRLAELTARRVSDNRDVTREVRSCLQKHIASEQVLEAVFDRGALTVRCRSASVASTLYFQRATLQRALSQAFGVRIAHVRFHT